MNRLPPANERHIRDRLLQLKNLTLLRKLSKISTVDWVRRRLSSHLPNTTQVQKKQLRLLRAKYVFYGLKQHLAFQRVCSAVPRRRSNRGCPRAAPLPAANEKAPNAFNRGSLPLSSSSSFSACGVGNAVASKTVYYDFQITLFSQFKCLL